MTASRKENKPAKKHMGKSLTSMKTAILLLFAIGAAASLGTLIPQGHTSTYYVENYGALLGKLIIYSSLDRIYTCWWFLALGALFCLNLFLCFLKRMKSIRKWQEVGSIFIHLSILVIVVGSILSALTGVSRNLEVAVGDTVDLASLGFTGYSLTVKDFEIEYYENQQPRQYKCDLLLIDPGGLSHTEKIMVNHPLKIQGIKIYQQSYGWQTRGTVSKFGATSTFQMKAGEEFVLDSQRDIVLKTFFIPDFDQQTQSLKTKSPIPNNPVLACAVLQENKMLDLGFLIPEEQKKIGEYTIGFTDYGYYSGLNIKKDPGTNVVFAGFVLMTVGFVIRYFFAQKAVGGGAQSGNRI